MTPGVASSVAPLFSLQPDSGKAQGFGDTLGRHWGDKSQGIIERLQKVAPLLVGGSPSSPQGLSSAVVGLKAAGVAAAASVKPPVAPLLYGLVSPSSQAYMQQRVAPTAGPSQSQVQNNATASTASPAQVCAGGQYCSCSNPITIQTRTLTPPPRAQNRSCVPSVDQYTQIPYLQTQDALTPKVPRVPSIERIIPQAQKPLPKSASQDRIILVPEVQVQMVERNVDLPEGQSMDRIVSVPVRQVQIRSVSQERRESRERSSSPERVRSGGGYAAAYGRSGMQRSFSPIKTLDSGSFASSDLPRSSSPIMARDGGSFGQERNRYPSPLQTRPSPDMDPIYMRPPSVDYRLPPAKSGTGPVIKAPKTFEELVADNQDAVRAPSTPSPSKIALGYPGSVESIDPTRSEFSPGVGYPGSMDFSVTAPPSAAASFKGVKLEAYEVCGSIEDLSLSERANLSSATPLVRPKYCGNGTPAQSGLGTELGDKKLVAIF